MRIFSFCFLLIFLPFFTKVQKEINIIPLPAEMQSLPGNFTIDENTIISFNQNSQQQKELAHFFASHIENISGINLLTNTISPKNKKIVLNIRTIKNLGEEGYELNVAQNNIQINANKPAGIFYAMQSLMQNLPAIRTNEKLEIPCMLVKDTPRFAWRGFMLDVSRHFFSVETVKEMLDLMAMFKLNKFHWHLVDDQGWRLEIKKYPKLTSVGAWRMEKEGAIFYEKDTAYLAQKSPYKYGGFYTQKQVKEIIDYAAFRNITIVPEIEMPGHSGAAIAAYPQYSCAGTSQPVPNIQMSGNFDWFHSNYCPGNPETFTFLENILTEVIELFPSKYIHIGGDEVDKKAWKACPRCQALMKKENLKDEEALQTYFITRMGKFISSKGRKMIGWGEIMQEGLAPNAVVMSWIGEKKGIEAANKKHEVIMCPSNPLYLNRHQTDSFHLEPPAPKYSINTLQKVYDYNPIPKELSKEAQKYILGTQAVIWTEFIRPVEHLEYMLFPRLCAFAEISWTPIKRKNYPSFQKRLKPILTGFEEKGINFFKKY